MQHKIYKCETITPQMIWSDRIYTVFSHVRKLYKIQLFLTEVM